MYSRNCDVPHRRLGADSDKIPEGGTSTYILHLSVCVLRYLLSVADLDPNGYVPVKRGNIEQVINFKVKLKILGDVL